MCFVCVDFVCVGEMMNALAAMMLLVAGAMAESHDGHDHGGHGHEKEACSCAQFEADHPFTIDCANGAAIRAATETLETTCSSGTNGEYEWGGIFETPGASYKWVAQATGDGCAQAYADPAMKLVVFATDEADQEHLLEKAAAAKTLMALAPVSATVSASTEIVPAVPGVVTIGFRDGCADTRSA